MAKLKNFYAVTAVVLAVCIVMSASTISVFAEINVRNAAAGQQKTIDVDQAFYTTGAAGYGTDSSAGGQNVISASGNTLTVGTGIGRTVLMPNWTNYFESGAMVSKFTLDFQRSFALEGSVSLSDATIPDGVTLGFTADNQWRIGEPGGCLGAYGLNGNGVPNAIVYELDLYTNTDPGILNESGIDSPHICIVTTDSNGAAENYSSHTNHTSGTAVRDLLNGSNTPFIISYDKDTDVLTFTLGTITHTYQNARNKLNGTSQDVKAHFFMTCAFNQSFYNSADRAGGQGALSLDKFGYTDEEPVVATKYLVGQTEISPTDVGTYAKKGETVTVEHTIYNNISTAAVHIPVRIPNFKIGTIAAVPTNITVGGTPTTENIVNDALAANGTYSTVDLELPANRGTTTITYDYVLADTVTNENNSNNITTTILLGQEGMTQYPFSSEGQVAGIPTVGSIGTTSLLVSSTQVVDDAFLNHGVTGRLYDETVMSSITDNPTDRQLTHTGTIDTAPGIYTLNFVLTDTRSNLAANAFTKDFIRLDDGFVVSPDNTYAVKANDTYIKSAQAMQLADQNALVTTMGAQGTNNQQQDVTPTVNTTSFAAIKAGTEGVYPVTFTVGSNNSQATVTKNLIVVPDSSVIAGSDAVYGVNATIQTTQATALTTIDDLKAILSAKGYINYVDVTNTNQLQVAVTTAGKDFANIQNGETGVYEIELTAGTATTTVSLLVVDDATTIISGTDVVSAQDATIQANEAAALTNINDLKTILDAKGYANYIDVTDQLQVAVSTVGKDFTNIQSGETGIYEIQFTVGTATKTAVLFVVDNDTIVSGSDLVSAKNGVIHVNDAAALTDINGLKAVLSAQGFVNNTEVTNTAQLQVAVSASGKDFTNIQNGEVGTYQIQFTAGTAMKTVDLIVVDDSVVTSTDNTVFLFAQNKAITVEQAKALVSQNDLFALHQSKLILNGVEDNTVLQVIDTISEDNFTNNIQAGVIGNYQIRFVYTDPAASGKSVEKVVTLTIADEVSPVVDNTQISASHIVMTIDEANALLGKTLDGQLADLITLSDAKAFNVLTGQSVAITSFASQMQADEGQYDVTFYSANGLEVTIKVTVVAVDNIMVNNTGGHLSNINTGDTNLISLIMMITVVLSVVTVVACLILKKRKQYNK